jgi:hypothetical protein
VFEIDQASGKIRCKACFSADPAKTTWITRGAAKRHLEESTEHVTNVQTNLKIHASEAAYHQRLLAPYSSQSYNNFDTSVSNPVPPARPIFFSSNDDLMPIDDDDDDIWGPIDHVVISAGLAPLTNDPSIENERLRREVELLMMEAEQYDELGPDCFEDDATITNVTEHLHSLRAFLSPGV